MRAKASRQKAARVVENRVPVPPKKETGGQANRLHYLGLLLVLAPCFWTSKIQAGDLSSHIYNAWLARLIRSGQAPGLEIAPQKTNVLFDWMLGALLGPFGAQAAQKIAVAVAVLVFFSGALAFVWKAAGRRMWHVMPMIAILAYGWTFHVGFFNFYISLGLCFWALALAWDFGPPPKLGAAALLIAVACVAHTLPVAWAACAVAYLWIVRRTESRHRTRLAVIALVALIGGVAIMRNLFITQWYPSQLMTTTGLDQMLVWGSKYSAVLLGLGILWLIQMLRLFRLKGARGMFESPLFHLCLITAAGVLLVPTRVMIPGYKHALVFIAERMSLALGICICALLSTVPVSRYERYATTALAVLYFGFVFHDERTLNALEDRMQVLVAQLPPNQRVISGIDAPDLRANPVTHMIDRICVGHCYSYSNYEPSTAQFRIRAQGDNPVVTASYQDSWLMQNGGYVVKERDLPLFQVALSESGRLEIRTLPAGMSTAVIPIDPL
jgi:hypothetical protein